MSVTQVSHKFYIRDVRNGLIISWKESTNVIG